MKVTEVLSLINYINVGDIANRMFEHIHVILIFQALWNDRPHIYM